MPLDPHTLDPDPLITLDTWIGEAEAAGHRTNLALAVFVFGGMVGLGVGPIVSGTLAERHGLPSLAWMMPLGSVWTHRRHWRCARVIRSSSWGRRRI